MLRIGIWSHPSRGIGGARGTDEGGGDDQVTIKLGQFYGVPTGRRRIGLGAHSHTSANKPCTRSTSCTSNILNIQHGQQLDLIVKIRDGDGHFVTGVTDL